MNIIFQSPHLYFREFTKDDVQLLFELNSNPNVIKYVHESAPTLENIIEILQNNILQQYKLYGYGRWAIHLKSSNEFIGWCGLKYIKEDDEIDLGYRFNENFWGSGYGYEAAKATIDYGFDALKLKRIVATALPQNIASWKIMEKCGMKCLGDIIDKDKWLVKKYEIRYLTL